MFKSLTPERVLGREPDPGTLSWIRGSYADIEDARRLSYKKSPHGLSAVIHPGEALQGVRERRQLFDEAHIRAEKVAGALVVPKGLEQLQPTDLDEQHLDTGGATSEDQALTQAARIKN